MEAFTLTIDYCFAFLSRVLDIIGGNDILSLFILLVIIYILLMAALGGKREK